MRSPVWQDSSGFYGKECNAIRGARRNKAKRYSNGSYRALTLIILKKIHAVIVIAIASFAMMILCS